MALDQSQLSSLMSVISEENTSTQTLEAIATSFHQFFNKPDFFKIGCALVTLLQNKDLIAHPTQRIVCIYFLYDMYRTDHISSNPFASVFIYLLNPPSLTQNGLIKEYNWSMPRLTPQEKFFVSQLITSPTKELFKKTANQILQADPSNLHNIDVSVLQVSIVEKLSELPHLAKVGVPCIISDPETNRYGFDETGPRNGSEYQKQCMETLMIGSDSPLINCMKPEFIRLAPPLHIAQDELVWLEPVENLPDYFSLDNSLMLNSTSTSSNTSEIRKLIAKAYKSQLNITQQQQLENALSKDSSLILHLDLTPTKFSNLVELNPLIAVKMILAYQELDSNDLSPYLDELLKMKMSVHSMEVVNKLAMLVILPDEFIHLYISVCISKCESMTDDRNLQNRLVRLLCAFIQSLIRNKIIDVKELNVELLPFCIEFSAIREANQLFRLLKSMNNENSVGVVSSQQQSSTQQQGSSSGSPAQQQQSQQSSNNEKPKK